MNENAIHGDPKKGREWRIAQSNHYAWLQTRGRRMHERSKLVGGGCMNKNPIHEAPKKGREWRIALSNQYAWLQTCGRRMHERKRNSWGSEKRVENGELH